jgi:hypothetical protein
MKKSKLLVILVVLCSFAFTTNLSAQTGGRKREHRNQRGGGGLFKRKKSGGHADAFAKGNRKGFFARVFKSKGKGKGPWVYRKTNPGVKQNKEQSRLFSRFRTKNKKYRDGLLAKQNKKRSSSRGKTNFAKKKR